MLMPDLSRTYFDDWSQINESKKLEMKMKKSLLFWISLFAVTAWTLTACAGGASASLTGSWKLISYGSKSNPTPGAPDVDTTVTFGSDGKISGNVGCNSFGGDYKVRGDKIVFGQIVSTLMGCPNPIGQQESAVFSAFTGEAAFNVDGSTLTIASADGNPVVVFAQK